MNNRHHFIEAQVNTQQYGRRPYGVGLLVIGHDVRVEHVSKKRRDA
jgi:20S proteasome alpha/beta subunit